MDGYIDPVEKISQVGQGVENARPPPRPTVSIRALNTLTLNPKPALKASLGKTEGESVFCSVTPFPHAVHAYAMLPNITMLFRV